MKLTLEVYQQLEAINSDKTLNDIDKSLFSICAVYGLTEEQLDNYKCKKVLYLADKVNKVFGKPFKLQHTNRVNLYKINYSIENITFGQYLELIYYTKGNDVMNKAQYIAATMAKTFYATEHKNRANYFLKCEAATIINAAIEIKNNFDTFNVTKFKALFEPYPEMQTDNSNMAKWFNENFGWFFSAESVAKFEGVTLEQAYQLPIVKALNDLMFLKAKGRYEYYIANRKN